MTYNEYVGHVKCLIIGSGPAGYTAAIYAARADLKPVLYTGIILGGQLTQTTEVDNFPGYPQGVTGPVLMEDLKMQAERFGTDVRFGYITKVSFSKEDGVHQIEVDGTQHITAESVIIATGAAAKWLGLLQKRNSTGLACQHVRSVMGSFSRDKM